MQFKNRQSANRHINTSHLNKFKFRCPYPNCGYKGSRADTLTKHMLGHSLIDSNKVSAYLGLSEMEEDDNSMDTSQDLHMDDNTSEEIYSQEVMRVSKPPVTAPQQILNNQQAIKSINNIAIDNQQNTSCKTTLIATSILDNGTVIYEPIQGNDAPSNDPSEMVVRQETSITTETACPPPPVNSAHLIYLTSAILTGAI